MIPTTSSRRAFGVLIAGALYAIAAGAAYWPVSPLDAHHLVGCACSDPVQEVWFLNWTSYALQHGLNPFFTNYMLAPHGADLGANTSMPLLGLLGMPVTVSLGPVATYNLLLRLAFAASGTSMFVVLRRYAKWQPAAFAGGLLFAFSPFMVTHGQRHLFLIFLPLLPPLIPLLDDWLISPRRSPLRSGLLLGAGTGLEYLISPEVVLLTALMVGIALIVLAFTYRDEVMARLPRLLSGTAAALVIFAVVAGYPIWMLLFGAQHPHGPPHPVADLDSFRENLLSPIVPTGTQAIAPAALQRVAHLPPLTFENALYLGIPFAGLLVYLAIRSRRETLVVVAGIVGLAAAILSLGTVLDVGSIQLLPVMPFRALAVIPILQNLEPARLTLFVDFAAAVIFAVGLDAVRSHGWTALRDSPPDRRRTLSVTAIALVALVPLVPRLPYPSVSARVPALFTTRAVDIIPNGAIALTYPYDYPPLNDAMSWQLASGMRFRIVGGDAFVPLPPGVRAFQTPPPGPKLAQRVLLNDSPTPPPVDETTARAVRSTCLLTRADVVLVYLASPDAARVARIFVLALGATPRFAGGMAIWTHVRADLRRR